MKNFSVKTADFDSLSISGESPIVQSDLGTAPNQIPLNKDLGSLAYMNAPEIEDLNVDTLELREIAAEMSDTAVDVFVYDTRKDSDGGAWRNRTSHTSWYNEELNTATRGGRREFPAVAVIVGEADKVTIYDGDDPNLSMWMVFDCATNNKAIRTTPSAIYALNSAMYVSTNGLTNALPWLNFISDTSNLIATTGIHNNDSIANRNNRQSWAVTSSFPAIINNNCNDVAMTVLPNAPIDENTGLPVPTIAVATDGGISVIKDDGSVVDITGATNYNKVMSVTFTLDRKLLYSLDYSLNSEPYSRYIRVDDIPSVDFVATSSAGQIGNSSELYSVVVGEGQLHLLGTDGANENLFIDNNIGNEDGLTFLERNKSAPANGMVAYATSSYNTGWMPGDIKLAALSDSVVETVGVDETTELLVDDSNNWVGDFNATTDIDSWIDQSVGTESVDSSNVSGGVLTLTRSTSNSEQISKLLNVEAGKKYKLTFDITATTNNKGQIWIGIDLPLENQLVDGTFTAESILNTGNNLGVGSYEYIFTAESTTYLTIRAGADDTISWDNISVKQTGELVESMWDDVSATHTFSSGGEIVITDDGADSVSGRAYQVISTIVGEKYYVSYDKIAGPAGASVYASVNTSFGTNLGGGLTSFGSQSFFFTATTTDTYILLTSSSTTGGSATFANISVRILAEDDRSVNNNGLQIFGQIDKTPVAPGADLVAYSGFSADDYLMQPYNSDLDFGTGDFSIMFWQKSTTHSDQEVFFNIGQDGVTDNRYIFYRPNGTDDLSFLKKVNNVATIILSVSDSLPLNTYNFIVGSRKDGVFKFYVNGRNIGSNNDISDLTFSGLNRTCIIGTDWNGTDPVQNMTLFRISATAPTDDQIAKIYRDEKVLFQNGAQVTLYGTSNAVTALAYDDKTELLNVGTSSGRSDFSGLRRINNTTTAVTTSISASNNLIAEQ